MKLTVTEEAALWYKEELDINNGEYLRFHVRYGGVGGQVPGFSLGVNTDSPQVIHTSDEVAGITFYIEEADAWYFEDKSLSVSFDATLSEPTFSYQ